MNLWKDVSTDPKPLSLQKHEILKLREDIYFLHVYYNSSLNKPELT